MNWTALSERRRVLMLALVLFAFSLLVYARTLGHGFVWDDEGMFVDNPAIRSLANIPAFFFTPEGLGSGENAAELGQDVRYYRPFLSVVHTLEYQLFGPAPLGYKVVNWLLNALVVTMAFLLAGALLGNWLTAFWGVLLYAAHPARSEVVYWAYSDSHLFAALFALTALLAWHRGRPALFAGLMAAGLLFQEGVLLLLPALLAYESALRPAELRSRWRLLLVPLLLAAGYLLLRMAAVGAASGAGLTPLPFGERLQAFLFVFAGLWRNLFWPEGLATVYIFRPGMFGAWGAAELWRIALVLLCGGGGVLLWRRRRALGFWYLWFFAWTSLALLIGPVGEYLLSEKSLFLAALGPCLLLAGLLGELPARRSVAACTVALALLYGGLTWQRGAAWSDTVTYLQQVLNFEPDFAIGHLALGVQQLERQDYAAAEASFLKVRQLRPNNIQLAEFLLECYDRQARDLASSGALRPALAVLEKSLRVSAQRSQTWNGIGIVRHALGDLPGAREAWRTAVSLDPGNAEAAQNLGLLH